MSVRDTAEHQCSRGCGKQADWQVGFRVWADREQHPDAAPLMGILGLYVCGEHHEVAPRDIFSDEGMAQITSQVVSKGRAAPDFDTAQVFLIPRSKWVR